MKKLFSILLMLVMCITMVSPATVMEVQAAETQTSKFSNWAISDLVVGDTYGIYPLTWYEKGLTGAIKQGKFRQLTYGIRSKLIDTGCATEKTYTILKITDSLTVKGALEAYYTLLKDYEFSADLGLTLGLDAVTYMKQIGVYTGQNGEQGLKDRCSMEQAMVMASRLITVIYEALDESSKGFLWQVKAGDNTVYMLGSIHLASNDIYPFSSDMWKAFFQSKALVVEANIVDQNDMLALQQMMYYADGTTLKDHVSADAYKKAVETAALLGVPEATTALLKPWALYLTFENYLVTATSDSDVISAQLGIDYTFLCNAMLYQKPVYAVEGAQKQGQILEGFSAGLQEYLLTSYSNLVNDILSGKDKESAGDMDAYMDMLFKSWKEGDIETFKGIADKEEEGDLFTGELNDEVKKYKEEFQNEMFTLRDDSMAKYIDNLLKAEGSNTYFVVLGSAHFISDYSVLDRLKKTGYEVTQIK